MKVDSIQNVSDQTRPILMIGMLILAVFFTAASRAIYSPLMPILQNELGISLSTAGTLFLLITISYTPAILFSGFLAARIGHGNTIVFSLVSISVGLLLTAFAHGITMLGTGLILIGVGAGVYPPSGVVMINTKISLERRSTAYSFHEIGPNLAFLLSPLIVLVMEPICGWRGVLGLMAAVCSLAALAFWRWGTSGSGVGAAPDFSTVRSILRLRSTFVGMFLLAAALAGLQGVYAILPAYLVSEHSFSPHHVNSLLTVSRIASVLLLLQAGVIIKYLGKRKTIVWSLLFTGLLTGLIGLANEDWVHIVVVAQPALLAVMFPAILSAIADIGESRYQNITYALIITVGVNFGGGLTPAVLGIFGDIGLGWLGFVALAGFMFAAVLYLTAAPDFGSDQEPLHETTYEG